MISRTPNATADIQLGDSFFDHQMSDDVRHARAPFHISTSLNWGCAKSGCTRSKGLSPCSACKAVPYCSPEHQRLGRPDHRLACAKVNKIHKIYSKEERFLSGHYGTSVFDEKSSHFARVDTLRYSTACVAFAETLLKSSNAHSCSMALDHLLRLVRLQRSDSMGVIDVIPALYVRLGQDQKAFDFCYWWATIGQQEDYDWFSRQGVFLDTQEANAFREAEVFTRPGISLSQITATTLLKIRLMIDLQSIYQARELAGPHVPQEVLDVILEYVPYSSVLRNIQDIKHEDIGQHIASLREQIGALYETVHKANPHFWPALIEPGNNLIARPTLYSFGDNGHMQLALQHNYNAWTESPGAIDVIKSYEKARSIHGPV